MNTTFSRFPWVARVVTFACLVAPLYAAQSSELITPYKPLIETCVNCHGTDGVSISSIPSLAGQSEAVLKAKLIAYKEQPHSTSNTIMTRLASSLSSEEITALARYYSSIQPSRLAPSLQ